MIFCRHLCNISGVLSGNHLKPIICYFSPFISNWLGASVETDAFGKALLNSGLSKKTIADWSVDPCVNLPGGEKGSVFDALEDMDVDDCLAKLVELNGLNADAI